MEPCKAREIKMYLTFTDFNATAPDGIIQYAVSIVPILPALILFSFFIIVMLASYFSEKRMTGKGNLSIAFAVAGLLTVIFATLLSIIPGIVNGFELAVCIVIAIIGIIQMFIPREPSY